jgi:hypothetical protein
MAVTACHLITQPLTSSALPTSDIDKYITIQSKICICTFYHISRSNGKTSVMVSANIDEAKGSIRILIQAAASLLVSVSFSLLCTTS